MNIEIKRRAITVDGYEMPRYSSINTLRNWMKRQKLAIHTLRPGNRTRLSHRGHYHIAAIGRISYFDGYKYGHPLALCSNGMHWTRILTYYEYRIYPVLTLVEPVGKIIELEEKGCSEGRKCLAIAPLRETVHKIFEQMNLNTYSLAVSALHRYMFTYYREEIDFNTIITAYLLSLAKKEGTR